MIDLKNLSLYNLQPINYLSNIISTDILYKDNDPIIVGDINPRSWSVVEYNLINTLEKFFTSKATDLNDKYIIKILEELNEDIGSKNNYI